MVIRFIKVRTMVLAISKKCMLATSFRELLSVFSLCPFLI